MTRRSRNKVRSRGKLVLNAYNKMVKHFAYIQGTLDWKEWSHRTISTRQAEILVATGNAEIVTRMVAGTVTIVGYRATSPTSWERPSPSTLTFATMNAVGKEAMHCQLTRREEREVLKFRVWPLIGDTKAVAVRPRMTETERRFAESLFLPRIRTSRMAVAA